MNKKQLIGKYKNLEGVWDAEGAELARRIFLQDLEQLDEQQKPVIPQFVADFIAEQKKHGLTLSYSIDASMSDGVAEWYWNNPELFVRAWLDGYEIEEEKRYLVKMKGVNKECEYLVFGELSNTWKLRSLGSFGELRKHHTRKELEEAGFGWIFSCEGIEVEEVEE